MRYTLRRIAGSLIAVIVLIYSICNISIQNVEAEDITEEVAIVDYMECDFYLIDDIEEHIQNNEDINIDIELGSSEEDIEVYANNLENYVHLVCLEPTVTVHTDINGNILIEGIDKGRYLMLVNDTISGGDIYYTEPTVFDIGDESMTITPKYGVLGLTDSKAREIMIQKIWDGDNLSESRPESIWVQLYKNGEVYAEVELNAENSWTYTWDSYDPMSVYAVLEKGVAMGYSATYERDFSTFIVTNTYEESIE